MMKLINVFFFLIFFFYASLSCAASSPSWTPSEMQTLRNLLQQDLTAKESELRVKKSSSLFFQFCRDREQEAHVQLTKMEWEQAHKLKKKGTSATQVLLDQLEWANWVQYYHNKIK